VIVCEDSDQLINLIATQEGIDVRDEADEGTNSIDVDSLPQFPEITAPLAPVPNPVRQQAQTFVQPPAQFAPQSQFQNAGQFQGQQAPPQFPPRPIAPRPVRPTRPSRPSGPFANLFGNFRLPFF